MEIYARYRGGGPRAGARAGRDRATSYLPISRPYLPVSRPYLPISPRRARRSRPRGSRRRRRRRRSRSGSRASSGARRPSSTPPSRRAISLHLRYISPYLPSSPLHLPNLPTSPHISLEQAREAAVRGCLAQLDDAKLHSRSRLLAAEEAALSAKQRADDLQAERDTCGGTLTLAPATPTPTPTPSRPSGTRCAGSSSRRRPSSRCARSARASRSTCGGTTPSRRPSTRRSSRG